MTGLWIRYLAFIMMPNMKDFIVTSYFDINMRTLEATTIHDSQMFDFPRNPFWSWVDSSSSPYPLTLKLTFCKVNMTQKLVILLAWKVILHCKVRRNLYSECIVPFIVLSRRPGIIDACIFSNNSRNTLLYKSSSLWFCILVGSLGEKWRHKPLVISQNSLPKPTEQKSQSRTLHWTASKKLKLQ